MAMGVLTRCLFLAGLSNLVLASQIPLVAAPEEVPNALFNSLEELSRLVDISYCITPGNPGISKPFNCLSRCSAFNSFELVTTWHTGLLITDSAGYIALSHAQADKRIVVAFRGTYSLANTVVDLATIPQAYVPYIGGNASDTSTGRADKCEKCKVHMGFYQSWLAARETIMPHLDALKTSHPSYRIELVGHSLGGAVAALAALDMEAKGWTPTVTTFGEPRVGNEGLVAFVDARFNISSSKATGVRYRRITHIDDPVPLLPLSEWGYVAHAGEIYISKSDIPPEASDLIICDGDADTRCIAGQDSSLAQLLTEPVAGEPSVELAQAVGIMANLSRTGLEVPSRFKLWQLLFAHRDYFWRLGLCLPQLQPDISPL